MTCVWELWRGRERERGRLPGYWLQDNWMNQGSSFSWIGKEKVLEGIAVLPLCVLMSFLVIVAASQVSFELVFTPEITQSNHPPPIQYSDEGTELRRSKAICPVFDSDMRESDWISREFVVGKELYRGGTQMKIHPMFTRSTWIKTPVFVWRSEDSWTSQNASLGTIWIGHLGHKHIQKLMGWFVLSWFTLLLFRTDLWRILTWLVKLIYK